MCQFSLQFGAKKLAQCTQRTIINPHSIIILVVQGCFRFIFPLYQVHWGTPRHLSCIFSKQYSKLFLERNHNIYVVTFLPIIRIFGAKGKIISPACLVYFAMVISNVCIKTRSFSRIFFVFYASLHRTCNKIYLNASRKRPRKFTVFVIRLSCFLTIFDKWKLTCSLLRWKFRNPLLNSSDMCIFNISRKLRLIPE